MLRAIYKYLVVEFLEFYIHKSSLTIHLDTETIPGGYILSKIYLNAILGKGDG